MAIASQEMFQICRFCLCQDEALLIPLEDMLDFAIAFQDVSAVTGIEINEDNIASYAMCLECTTKLKSSVAFRKACLSNESHFQELCAVLSASVKESRIKIIDTIDLSDICDESTYLNLNTQDACCDDFVGSPDSNEDFSKSEKFIEERDETSELNNTEGDQFSYSANYIEPGEILFSEDEDIKHLFDWKFSLNPPAPPPDPYIREPGKRKLHLCEICGLKVIHIPKHFEIHADEYKYSCPHCPVKVKQKPNLQQHIQTVHLKTIMKTCELCGKGFVHHKTYRYHMLDHQGEGKIFECVDCSKTFTNSIYLRDHIKRLHNADKQIKTKVPGESSRRKRNRSSTVIENVK